MKNIDLLIIGAGPAGLMAAIKAADCGLKVTMMESMPKPARKLGISGKGRGNLTNIAPLNEFLKHFNNEGRFLKTTFRSFFNDDLVSFFNKEGLETVNERGGRVFVASGKATDAVKCLHNAIEKRKVTLITGTPVSDLIIRDKTCLGASSCNSSFYASNTLLATGGLSYPLTGSTGDGLKLAKKYGHEIIQTLPSLVALKPEKDFSAELNGLTLKNVNAELRINGRKISSEQGEMMFQDNYLAGPIVITLSRKAVPELSAGNKVEICIDLKPALDHSKLDKRILREINSNLNSDIPVLLSSLIPRQLHDYCIRQNSLNPDTKLNNMTSEQRRVLRNWLKEMKFSIAGAAPWSQAIVTAGGVSTKQVNPATMESKLIKNLYFAGEILDIDADTGGFNLQAAFSTGWLAAASIAASNDVQAKE